MRQLPYYDAQGNAPNMTAFQNNVILWYTNATNRDPPLRPSPMPVVSEAPELNALIERAWAKEPELRPTAVEMRDRLAEVMIKMPTQPIVSNIQLRGAAVPVRTV